MIFDGQAITCYVGSGFFLMLQEIPVSGFPE